MLLAESAQGNLVVCRRLLRSKWVIRQLFRTCKLELSCLGHHTEDVVDFETDECDWEREKVARLRQNFGGGVSEVAAQRVELHGTLRDYSTNAKDLCVKRVRGLN